MVLTVCISVDLSETSEMMIVWTWHYYLTLPYKWIIMTLLKFVMNFLLFKSSYTYEEDIYVLFISFEAKMYLFMQRSFFWDMLQRIVRADMANIAASVCQERALDHYQFHAQLMDQIRERERERDTQIFIIRILKISIFILIQCQECVRKNRKQLKYLDFIFSTK